ASGSGAQRELCQRRLSSRLQRARPLPHVHSAAPMATTPVGDLPTQQPGIHTNDTIGDEMISSRIHHIGRSWPHYGTFASHFPDISALTSGHVARGPVRQVLPARGTALTSVSGSC